MTALTFVEFVHNIWSEIVNLPVLSVPFAKKSVMSVQWSVKSIQMIKIV